MGTDFRFAAEEGKVDSKREAEEGAGAVAA